MARVSFTGTRGGMTTAQLDQFSRLVRELLTSEPLRAWHDGDCIGADSQAHHVVAHISRELVTVGSPKIHMVGHPGNTPQYYASNVFDESREIKGNIDRNHDMVDEAEVLIACPGSSKEIQRSGTWATVRYARERVNAGQNLVILIIYPDGTVEKEQT